MTEKDPLAVISQKTSNDIINCQSHDVVAALNQFFSAEIVDLVWPKISLALHKRQSIYSCLIFQELCKVKEFKDGSGNG